MKNAFDGFRKTISKIGTKLNDLKAKNVYFDNPTNLVFTDDKYLDALNEGSNIAKGICIARDLVNEPANVLIPEELANRTLFQV